MIHDQFCFDDTLDEFFCFHYWIEMNERQLYLHFCLYNVDIERFCCTQSRRKFLSRFLILMFSDSEEFLSHRDLYVFLFVLQ